MGGLKDEYRFYLHELRVDACAAAAPAQFIRDPIPGPDIFRAGRGDPSDRTAGHPGVGRGVPGRGSNLPGDRRDEAGGGRDLRHGAVRTLLR